MAAGVLHRTSILAEQPHRVKARGLRVRLRPLPHAYPRAAPGR